MAQAPPDTKQSLLWVPWTLLGRCIEILGWPTAAALAMLLVLGCSWSARAQSQQSDPLNQQTDGTGQSVANRSGRGEQLAALPDTPEPKPGERPSPFAPLNLQEQDTIYVPIAPRQQLQWAISATFAPQGLLAGGITSGVGTARNSLTRMDLGGPVLGSAMGRGSVELSPQM
jgi:hypothetical protein